ncbi:MAG: YdeI/OmpD-associated family protein [Verrucomicrobia bacterium]|nr:YdeI/OmpD-associated family protein [Verrucomicrobiota bacterium]
MPLRVSDLDYDAPPPRRAKAAPWVRLTAPVSKWFMGHCLEWNHTQLAKLVQPGEKNVPINLRVAGLERESTLLPAGPGRLRVIIASVVLKAARAQLGSELTVEVQRVPPRQPPENLPSELLAALQRRPGALELFRAMSISNQRALVRVVAEIKSEESRRRRSEKLTEQLFEMAARKKPQREAGAAEEG